MKTKHTSIFNLIQLDKGTSKITAEQWFLLSAMIVNAGNYAYNLIVGRLLGPERYAEASLLITLLLVLSFIAMTLQLSVAKFQAGIGEEYGDSLSKFFMKRSIIVGVVIMIGFIFCSSWLSDFFQTNSVVIFPIFALCIPLYFIMSVRRGEDQGKQNFIRLSFSYQSEMWGRLLLTISLLYTLTIDTSIVIVIGIVGSILLGLLPKKNNSNKLKIPSQISKLQIQSIYKFAIITGIYELAQIMINNSDILMVKHFFDAESAGLYAGLAMIGRVVYFLAWMFIMMLLPKVIKIEKEGKDSGVLLMKYVGYTTLLGLGVVTLSIIAPELIVGFLFGDAYMSIVPMLWLYALSTACFAVANIFAYYALSLERYIPIVITVFFGLAQIILITWFHDTIAQVVWVQIIAMVTLLIIQISYYLIQRKISN